MQRVREAFKRPIRLSRLNSEANLKTSRTRRPLGILVISAMILCLSVWNGLRLIEAIVFWNTLTEYQVKPGVIYIAVGGGTWFVVSLMLLWVVWTVKHWGRWAITGFIVLYSAYYWFDRLAYQVPHANWPFAIVINLILGSITLLLLLMPGTGRYFRQSETLKRRL
jgi:hypothetical protein